MPDEIDRASAALPEVLADESLDVMAMLLRPPQFRAGAILYARAALVEGGKIEYDWLDFEPNKCVRYRLKK